MTQNTMEEKWKEFGEYMSNGYAGGKEGLRCSECDSKYSGTSSVRQLCPRCRARELLSEKQISYQEGFKKAMEEVEIDEPTMRAVIEKDIMSKPLRFLQTVKEVEKKRVVGEIREKLEGLKYGFTLEGAIREVFDKDPERWGEPEKDLQS